MNSTITSLTRINPRVCMDRLILQAENANGIDTRQLRAGDTLVIRTCNTFYTLRLADPGKGAGVATSDGRFITDESEASLLGSTLSGRGTMVKMGWILLGYRMVLFIPGQELVTSPVQSVMVNGMPVVPAAGTH
ncbi:MAG: hypothetical protein ACE5HV_14055 [Acidobacteriota bacterium]